MPSGDPTGVRETTESVQIKNKYSCAQTEYASFPWKSRLRKTPIRRPGKKLRCFKVMLTNRRSLRKF